MVGVSAYKSCKFELDHMILNNVVLVTTKGSDQTALESSEPSLATSAIRFYGTDPNNIKPPVRFLKTPGKPGLVDRVLALHARSRWFDSHRRHMSEQFFRSNRPGYQHPVSSELENSGIRVAVRDCSVTERRHGIRLIKPAKLYMCMQNTTNTTRTDAQRRVCAAMVPYH